MKKLTLAALIMFMTLGLTACGQDDDEAMDMEEAAEQAGDSAEEGAENTGDAIEDGADATGDAAEDMGDDMEEETDEM